MGSKLMRSTIFAFSLGIGLCSVPYLWSQTGPPSQRLPYYIDANFAGAANRWRLAAIDPRSQVDTVSPQERAQRDAYWKPRLEEDWKEDARGLVGRFPAWGSKMPPEFTVTAEDIWAIAKFESFRVYAVDPDDRLIYTEINWRVQHVFKQPEWSDLSNGSLIDDGMEGGRIKNSSGDVASFEVRPSQDSVRPGHTYLLRFGYEAQGGFYSGGTCWDISSGKVEIDGGQCPVAKQRAAEGKSAIAGMSVPDLMNNFPSILAAAPEESETSN
jgi:hypothetical protein